MVRGWKAGVTKTILVVTPIPSIPAPLPLLRLKRRSALEIRFHPLRSLRSLVLRPAVHGQAAAELKHAGWTPGKHKKEPTNLCLFEITAQLDSQSQPGAKAEDQKLG